jgi:hypothetical protein
MEQNQIKKYRVIVQAIREGTQRDFINKSSIDHLMGLLQLDYKIISVRVEEIDNGSRAENT